MSSMFRRSKAAVRWPKISAGSGSECRWSVPGRVDIRKLRDRLCLTQDQFALRFGLELDAGRNWEYGRREPDAAAKAYLTVIDRDPEAVQEALAVPVK